MSVASDSIFCWPCMFCPTTSPSSPFYICSCSFSPEAIFAALRKKCPGDGGWKCRNPSSVLNIEYKVSLSTAIAISSASFLVVHKEGGVLLSEKWMPPSHGKFCWEMCFCRKLLLYKISGALISTANLLSKELWVLSREENLPAYSFLFCHTISVLNTSQRLLFESGSWFLELFSHPDLKYKE